MSDQYFISDAERIFRELVKKPQVAYCEIGKDFYRFRDTLTGKLFTISVKEYVPRVKKIKKVTFKNDVI